MTTTVTIKTHGFPVKVTTVDRYTQGQRSGEAEQLVHTERTIIETVPPHSERSFTLTDTRSVAFDELPQPAPPAIAEQAT